MNNSVAPVYYSAETVRRYLSWPLVIEAVESALKAVVGVPSVRPPNAAFVNQPKRSFTECHEPKQLLLTMPAFVGNYTLTSGGGDAANIPRSTLACKVVSSFSGNPQRQPPLPSISANILLFSQETGELTAIMAGTDITTWRTVAASLLATKHLYFRRFGPHAEHELEITLAIIGCGVQGQMHATAFCTLFKVKQLNLYNRTTAKAEQLKQTLLEQGTTKNTTQIRVCSSPAVAVQEADVICIATYSAEPLLHASQLSEGTDIHINAVGAGENACSEVAQDVYDMASIYVDCYANAEAEMFDLLETITELGWVLKGNNKGRYPDASDVTIFQSMGMASEDACVAQAVQDAILSDHK